MRDTGTASLERAYAQGWAISAFWTYTQEITQAIRFRGAGHRSAGDPASRRQRLQVELAAQAVLAADLAGVPVGVHLDHSRDLDQVKACLAAGYTSVRVDSTALPFEQNVEFTRAAVEAAAAYGAWVEGELGAIPGDEDRSQAGHRGELTDLARASIKIPALADPVVASAV